MSFEDRTPNVKANPLSAHGNASVNMVGDCPNNFRVFDVRRIQRYLVEMHRTLIVCPEVERACCSDQSSVGRKRDDHDFP